MSRTSISFSLEERDLVRHLAAECKTTFEISQILTETKRITVSKRMIESRCRKELLAGHLEAAQKGLILPGRLHTTLTVGANQYTNPETSMLVRKLAGFGLRNDDIANCIGMSASNLYLMYADDVRDGRSEAHKEVAGTLYEMATSGEFPSMTSFYLKAQCGWRETAEVVFPDEDGIPQKIGANLSINAESMQMIIALLNEKV